MDLNRFDTREKASAGVSFPLVIDGETQYGDDDQPITFTVKGAADPDVQTILLKQRDLAGAETPQEVRDRDMKLARAAVIGWSGNFTVAGEKVPFSRSAIDVVLDNPVVRSSVLMNVAKQRDFMNGSSQEPSSTSAKKRG